MCTSEYKSKFDQETIQSFLDESWPMNTSTGDVQNADASRDGEVGDIASLVFLIEKEDSTLDRETKLFIRNPAGVGSSTFVWSEYIPPELG